MLNVVHRFMLESYTEKKNNVFCKHFGNNFFIVACKYEINATESKHFITSPDYPDNYPLNANCTWKINIPEYHVLTLFIEELVVEKCCDHLMVSVVHADIYKYE